jgi:hypothetical protein
VATSASFSSLLTNTWYCSWVKSASSSVAPRLLHRRLAGLVHPAQHFGPGVPLLIRDDQLGNLPFVGKPNLQVVLAWPLFFLAFLGEFPCILATPC